MQRIPTLHQRLNPTPTRQDRDRAHRRARHEDPERQALNALYSGTRWQRLRQVVLGENPLCTACQEAGITTPALDVDHVVPAAVMAARHGPTGFYVRENLRGLCRSHHNAATQAARGGE